MTVFRELIQGRELLFFLTWRDVKIRYKQTAFGAAWAVLQPLITMIVFTIFFGRLAGIDTGGIPYPVFAYSALLPWTFFAASVTNAGNSLVGNTDLLTKVYFPRPIIPISSVLSCLVDFVVASTLLLGLMAYYGIAPSLHLLLWPVVIGILVVLALGVGMLLAAVNVAYRDVKYALPFVIQLLLFLTPVIYPTTIVPEKYRPLMSLNPLTGIIEASRASLLPDRPVPWAQLGVSVAITAVLFTVGVAYFRRVEGRFADIV